MSTIRLTSIIVGAFLTISHAHGEQAEKTYSFGVLTQRTANMTAQYWNPIFDYVKKKTGVAIELKVAKTAPESAAATARGEYDFVYSNHIFMPKVAKAGYKVILRPNENAITGQIVTLANSPIKTLNDLEGKEVGFPSKSAVVGYAVPMDELSKKGIAIKPVFGGNQEGIMGQLKTQRVIAAGVNGYVMKQFADREKIDYRILWESRPFLNIPVAVAAHTPKDIAEKVRDAIDSMDDNPEGLSILENSAKIIGQAPPYGFKKSSDRDYDSYIEFYKNTLLKEFLD